ncbi:MULTISPECIES: cation-transporting P-type ATPase [unclassified Nonomuraea]|uniref:cation-transporting P-type ATPase n=1 Tax=unclassified Nonomuraea TaxID=2593643 RepID=UPI0033FC5644
MHDSAAPKATAGGKDIHVTPSSSGLSSAEAAVRLERDGPNLLPRKPPTPLWRRVVTQLRDPLIIVLLIAAALTVGTGDWTDAAVIALVIVVNTAVGVTQEVRADRAITALAELATPETRVVRDGHQRHIPSGDVVVGDCWCSPRATSSRPTPRWWSRRRCWSTSRR